jgi:hypothetical protein
MSWTDLRAAYLRLADLRGVVDLAPAQVQMAKLWDKGIYDPDFRVQLGLSREAQPESPWVRAHGTPGPSTAESDDSENL